jgi:hypothetical protein
MIMSYTTIHTDPIWRCPCGAPVRASDFRVEPNEIVLDCRRCCRRLLEIQSESDTAPEAAA